MKKITALVIGVLLVGTTAVYADSSVKGTVTNNATVKNGVNSAIGKGATANMATVTLKNSSVDGTVTNNATIEKGINSAIGEDASASMGSVTME
jgi:hypothetical protein